MHLHRSPVVPRDGESLAAMCFALLLAMVMSISRVAAADSPYRFERVLTVAGPCCTDMGVDLVVDDNDSVLVTGRRGGLDFDRDGKVDLDTHGTPDTLVFMSHDGNESGWIVGPGGPKEDLGKAIASDRQGGAFVVGGFMDRLDLGETVVSGRGKRDGFLTRYDQDGNPIWTVVIGGAENDELSGVTSDAAGNAYVAGRILGPVRIIADESMTVDAPAKASLLIASFDPEGRLRWNRVVGGDAEGFNPKLHAGPDNAIYVGGGYFRGALDLDLDGEPDVPVAVTDPAAKDFASIDMNGFYARLDVDGRVQWVRSISGPRSQVIGALTTMLDGDLVVSGGYVGDVDFDSDGKADLEWKALGADNNLRHSQDLNAFLLRVSPAGEHRWARRYTAGGHVAARHDGLVIGGRYTGELDLDDDGTPERESDEDDWSEGFVAVLDADGAVEQVFTVVGGDGDAVSAVGATADGRKLYATGFTRLGADFDGDGKIESASKCHQLGDLYLAVYELESPEPE